MHIHDGCTPVLLTTRTWPHQPLHFLLPLTVPGAVRPCPFSAAPAAVPAAPAGLGAVDLAPPLPASSPAAADSKGEGGSAVLRAAEGVTGGLTLLRPPRSRGLKVRESMPTGGLRERCLRRASSRRCKAERGRRKSTWLAGHLWQSGLIMHSAMRACSRSWGSAAVLRPAGRACCGHAPIRWAACRRVHCQAHLLPFLLLLPPGDVEYHNGLQGYKRKEHVSRQHQLLSRDHLRHSMGQPAGGSALSTLGCL